MIKKRKSQEPNSASSSFFLQPERSRIGKSTFSGNYYLHLRLLPCWYHSFTAEETGYRGETICHLSIHLWKDGGNRAKTGNKPFYLLALLENSWRIRVQSSAKIRYKSLSVQFNYSCFPFLPLVWIIKYWVTQKEEKDNEAFSSGLTCSWGLILLADIQE